MTWGKGGVIKFVMLARVIRIEHVEVCDTNKKDREKEDREKEERMRATRRKRRAPILVSSRRE